MTLDTLPYITGLKIAHFLPIDHLDNLKCVNKKWYKMAVKIFKGYYYFNTEKNLSQTIAIPLHSCNFSNVEKRIASVSLYHHKAYFQLNLELISSFDTNNVVVINNFRKFFKDASDSFDLNRFNYNQLFYFIEFIFDIVFEEEPNPTFFLNLPSYLKKGSIPQISSNDPLAKLYINALRKFLSLTSFFNINNYLETLENKIKTKIKEKILARIIFSKKFPFWDYFCEKNSLELKDVLHTFSTYHLNEVIKKNPSECYFYLIKRSGSPTFACVSPTLGLEDLCISLLKTYLKEKSTLSDYEFIFICKDCEKAAASLSEKNKNLFLEVITIQLIKKKLFKEALNTISQSTSSYDRNKYFLTLKKNINF